MWYRVNIYHSFWKVPTEEAGSSAVKFVPARLLGRGGQTLWLLTVYLAGVSNSVRTALFYDTASVTEILVYFMRADSFTTQMQVCPGLFIVNLTQVRDTREEEPHLRNLCQIACRAVCRAFSWLVIDGGRLRLLGAVLTPGPVVLGGMRKQAVRNKLANSTLPRFLLPFPALSFCPGFSLSNMGHESCKIKWILPSMSCFW